MTYSIMIQGWANGNRIIRIFRTSNIKIGNEITIVEKANNKYIEHVFDLNDVTLITVVKE